MTGAQSPSNSSSVARRRGGRCSRGGDRRRAADARRARGSVMKAAGIPKNASGIGGLRERRARAGHAGAGDGRRGRADRVDRRRRRDDVRRPPRDADGRHVARRAAAARQRHGADRLTVAGSRHLEAAAESGTPARRSLVAGSLALAARRRRRLSSWRSCCWCRRSSRAPPRRGCSGSRARVRSISGLLGGIGSVIGGTVGKLAVTAFDAIIHALFAPIAHFINTQLIGWLVAVPDYAPAGSHVAATEHTVLAMAGAALGAVATISIARFWVGRAGWQRRLGARGAWRARSARRCCCRSGRGCFTPRSRWRTTRAPGCSDPGA